MARDRIVIDLASGQQTVVPYTAQEEAEADISKAADDLLQAQTAAQQQRVSAIKANGRRQALVTAIQNNDDVALINYVNTNVTDLPSARTMLANLALLVAGVIRA